LNVLEHNKRCSALSNENLEVLITRISLSRLFSVAAFAPTALESLAVPRANQNLVPYSVVPSTVVQTNRALHEIC